MVTAMGAEDGNGMTVPEIRAEVAEITDLYDTDPEAAHGREDDLLARFIRWIAVCEADPMAAELVKLLDADRVNYCGSLITHLGQAADQPLTPRDVAAARGVEVGTVYRYLTESRRRDRSPTLALRPMDILIPTASADGEPPRWWPDAPMAAWLARNEHRRAGHRTAGTPRGES
jgi:hypothetical protein